MLIHGWCMNLILCGREMRFKGLNIFHFSKKWVKMNWDMAWCLTVSHEKLSIHFIIQLFIDARARVIILLYNCWYNYTLNTCSFLLLSFQELCPESTDACACMFILEHAYINDTCNLCFKSGGEHWIGRYYCFQVNWVWPLLNIIT